MFPNPLFRRTHNIHTSSPIAIIEDTYVTGATAQSAAHTINHNPTTIITISRRLQTQP